MVVPPVFGMWKKATGLAPPGPSTGMGSGCALFVGDRSVRGAAAASSPATSAGEACVAAEANCSAAAEVAAWLAAADSWLATRTATLNALSAACTAMYRDVDRVTNLTVLTASSAVLTKVVEASAA